MEIKNKSNFGGMNKVVWKCWELTNIRSCFWTFSVGHQNISKRVIFLNYSEKIFSTWDFDIEIVHFFFILRIKKILKRGKDKKMANINKSPADTVVILCVTWLSFFFSSFLVPNILYFLSKIGTPASSDY